MKTLKKDIPVLLAAVLFVVCGLPVLRSYLILSACSYFLVAIVLLLRRRKDGFRFFLLLTMSLVIVMRFVILWIMKENSSVAANYIKTLYITAGLFTAGVVIFFAFVLLDVVDGWKRFRAFTGPLWFGPGAWMLLASLIGMVSFALIVVSEGNGFLVGVVAGLAWLTNLMLGPLEALAVLLLSFWLYRKMPEELEPYQDLRNKNVISEAELEETRRKLGLQKRKARRTDAGKA